MSSAFDLQFPVWPPPLTVVKHGHEAPLGAVVIKRVKHAGIQGRGVRYHRHRAIKFRMDGTPARRWMHLARFWWIQNKGAVPAGMRVAHLDLDPMNDDPANYALFTPGDMIASHHIDRPKWSAKQRRRCGAGTAKFNIERGRINRAIRWLTNRWYGVDLAERRIINQPVRERWQIYQAHGVSMDLKANGGGVMPAVIGFAGVSTVAAAVLATLVKGPLPSREFFPAVAATLKVYRLPVPTRGRILAAMTPLYAMGWLEPRKGWRGYYRLAAAPARRPSPVVAVKGSELGSPEFSGFSRVDPDGNVQCAQSSIKREEAA